MKLTRDFFKTVGEEIKNEVSCIIPNGNGTDYIDEIDTNAFIDWTNLKYVYVPPTVKSIAPDAFDYSKVAFMFIDKRKTKIQGDIGNVKLIQITEQSIELFDLLIEVLDIKTKLNYSPKELDDINASIMDKIAEFSKEIKANEATLDANFSEMMHKAVEIETMCSSSKEKIEEIFENLSEEIAKCAKEAVNGEEATLKGVSAQLMQQLNTAGSKMLTDIDNTFTDLKNQLTAIRGEIQGFEQRKAKLKSDVEKATNALEGALEEANQYLQAQKAGMVNQVVEEASKRIEEINPCKQVVINIGDVQHKFGSKELFHRDFEEVLKLVSLHIPLLLKGPAGSGKNVIIEQVAKAMGLQFYYVNDVTDEYKIMGFVDANGNFKETQFFQAFTKGGVMFVDEIDNSNPSALLAINAAIGTGYNHYMAFPDGKFYQAHKDFYLIAAANTFGTGADAIYSGRQALDGATLNRFIPIVIDYDQNLERQLISNKDILNLYWSVRKIVNENQIRHVISTRNIKNADNLIRTGSFSIERIFDWTIIQGLDLNSLRIISARLTGNDSYTTRFLEHLRNKYDVSSNEYEETTGRSRVRTSRGNSNYGGGYYEANYD